LDSTRIFKIATSLPLARPLREELFDEAFHALVLPVSFRYATSESRCNKGAIE